MEFFESKPSVGDELLQVFPNSVSNLQFIKKGWDIVITGEQIWLPWLNRSNSSDQIRMSAWILFNHVFDIIWLQGFSELPSAGQIL